MNNLIRNIRRGLYHETFIERHILFFVWLIQIMISQARMISNQNTTMILICYVMEVRGSPASLYLRDNSRYEHPFLLLTMVWKCVYL